MLQEHEQEKIKNMEKDIKIIFFDVDGTLYDATSDYVNPTTIKALYELKNKDIEVVMCTGRGINELNGLPKVLKDFPFDGYVTSGGGEVYYHGEKIFTSYIDFSIMHSLCPYIYDSFNDIDTIFLDINGSGTIAKMRKHGMYNFDWFHQEPYPIREMDIQHVVHLILCMEVEKYPDIIDLVKDTTYLKSSAYSLEIFAKNINKMHGIQQILHKTNINIEQTMAFGDSENDHEMLMGVHLGVAMGNANEETKKYASYICDSMWNDGIYKALKFWGIIK